MRQTLRAPGWVLAAASILGLGIGASVALYSVVEAVLLRAPMFAAPADLAVIWESDPKRAQAEVEISWERFLAMRKSAGTLAGLASVSSVNLDFALLDGGDPVQVEGVSVTANYFDVLGVRPVLGRTLVAADEVSGDVTAVVISHRLWTERFGGQPGVVERRLRISGSPCRVVGVMPAGFTFPRGVDIWAPQTSLERFGDLRVLKLVGRRLATVSWGQVAADLNVVLRRLDEKLPEARRGFTAHVVPMDQAVYGNARMALWTLMGASFLLLLTACANVANLFLARVAGRSRELAIRTALGAGRFDLVRLLMGEAFLVSAVAGGLGLLLASWLVSLASRFGPEDVPGLSGAALSWDGLAVAGILVVGTALVVGLAPFVSLGAARLRDVLVVSEVAVSLLLVIGCGLVGRSLWNLSRIDPGFEREGLLTFRVTLAGEAANSQAGRKKFYRELLAKLRAMPGVTNAAAVLIRPLSGSVGWDSAFTVDGQSPEDAAGNPYANYEAVSPGYFSTMGMSVVAGREFSDGDRQGVLMINASAARRFFGGPETVGKRIKLGGSTEWLTVIGVVPDARYREWEAARVDLYVPVEQRAQHRSDFVVRTSVGPETLVEPVRRAVLELHAEQPISNVTIVAKLVDGALARPRFLALLFGFFGAAALVLTVAGLFAVLRFVFAATERDMAIRMAVGATPGDLRNVVLRFGLVRVMTGILIGLAGAGWAVRLVEPLLFGVTVFDAWVWTGAIGLLIGASVIAALGPAWRAGRVDPQRLLQQV